MAFRQDKNGNVSISGFEQGIADSPESGIADLRSINITSIPGEASVSFATTAGNTPPNQTGVSYTATSANSTLTVSSTSGYYNGMAIKIASTSSIARVSALLVGGGGGGGTGLGTTSQSSGGGAGGDVVPVSNSVVAIGTYPVVVGAGNSAGVNGGDSSFNGTTAKGGGSGGGGSGAAATGGSGGGGFGGSTGAAGTGTNVHAGGNGGTGGPVNTGGGGGGAGTAGTAGVNGVSPQSGVTGGNGFASSISGASVTYGAGGGSGGVGATSVGGAGGTGGGGSGAGGDAGVNAIAGTAGTGSGGGGAASQGGGSGAGGGSGVVIISYPTGTLTATGGTITTSGGNTIHTFAAGTTNFVVTAINPQVGDVYYIGDLTSTTFKIYYDPTISHLVTMAGNSTGTFDIPIPTTPVFDTTYGLNSAVASAMDNLEFMIDNTGNAWLIPTSTINYTGGIVTAGSLQYCGNTNHQSTGTGADFGIAVWNGYLFTFIKTNIEYISLANLFDSTVVSNAWVYSWKTSLNQTSYNHQVFAPNPSILVFCNGSSVGYINLQGTSFDPQTSSTYTLSTSAVSLGLTDATTCLGAVQTQNLLLIGSTSTRIYTADLTNLAGGLTTILTCADAYATRIVGTNTNAYIFTGFRGRIFVTNGSQIQMYKKIPDSLSGDPEPYYTWQDAKYARNKLYFTLTAKNNAGSTLSTMGGIWSLQIENGQSVIQLPTAGSLVNINQLSYGTYGGSAPCVFVVPYTKFLDTNPPGYGVGAIWVNSGTINVDVPGTAPYTGSQSYIDTDIIPVGTYFKKTTFKNLEFKLSRRLVSGESVAISARNDLNGNFTALTLNEGGGAGDISGVFTTTTPLEKAQWVQFRVTLASTASNPSYVRLTELLLHHV